MPGLIPPHTLEQVRAASDIVEIIGGYFPLKRAGANFVALCPFHREKTPSFNVNPHRQIFHCFGCHKGGDVFTFVQEYEHVPFIDAVRRLAERAGIPLEFADQPGQREARHIKDTLLQMHEQIAQRWHAVLLNDAAGQIARDYLAKRRVTEEAVKRFRLGCAPDAWDDTVNWARSKGYDLALVEKAGLIIAKSAAGGEPPEAPIRHPQSTTRHYYDRFRGRLMFPICDEQGRVIGFSGRALAGDEKTAKYVNSPETPIFTKGRVIYGLDKARRAMLDAGFAVVCEGQLDLIACHMAGVENVVAPQGTALTADHARILKRYVQEVVLCFDSDTAGQNAAIRSLDPLLASGLAIRVATVPAPHDPDSLIKAEGGEAFRRVIERAEGFFDHRLNRLCAAEDVATDRGRQAVLRAMAEDLLKTSNHILIDTYARKTALRLGVSADAVLGEFRKVKRPRAPADGGKEPATGSAETQRPSPQEFWLLKLLLLHEDLADWAVAHLDPQWLPHAAVRRIVTARLNAHRQGDWQGVPALIDRLEDSAAGGLITEAVAENRPIPDPAKQLADVLTTLRNKDIDRQLALLNQQLARPDQSEEEHLAILRQQQSLRELKRRPLAPPA